MPRRVIIFLGIAYFLSASFAFSQLEFSEIMYDLPGSDEGKEWIEVFNNSSEEVDLAKYKLFEAGTNHKIVFKEGSASVPAFGYAILVSNYEKFKADWPWGQLNIFDSSFSLSNVGETISLKDGERAVFQYSYSSNLGGKGDGASLQKIGGAWISALPTPGRENKITLEKPKMPPVASSTTKSIKAQDAPTEEEFNMPSHEVKNIMEMSADQVVSTEGENPLYFFVFILLTFLVTTSALIYFVRRASPVKKPGEDFELMD
jgi:hypothetical protein